MTTQLTVSMNLPEVFSIFSEFLPKFETIVQQTLAKRSAGTCNLSKIVGNPNDTQAFMTLVDVGTMLKWENLSLKDYPFDVIDLDDYPINVLGVLNSLEKFWENAINKDLVEGEEVDTFQMALESTHDLLNEVLGFVDSLPEIRNEFFTSDAELNFITTEEGKVVISAA